MTRFWGGLGWLLVSGALAYFAYGVGHGIGAAHELQACRWREAASESAQHAIAVTQPPPVSMLPAVDCVDTERAHCCFQRFDDERTGRASYSPIGCLPAAQLARRNRR